MNNVPAGWYPNPYDTTVELYWDGDDWTDSSRPAQGVVAEEEPAAPAVPLRERLRIWTAAVFTPLLLRRAGAVALVVLLAWALVTGFSRCARRAASPEPAGGGLTFKKGVPSVIQEPPEPYLDLPVAKESTP